MQYEYDVFISYKTGAVFGTWVHEIFFNIFEDHLDQSLGYKSKIFIDTRQIRDGASWPDQLKLASIKSKSMVAVLSPLYFVSNWCKNECSIMLAKEDDTGFRTQDNPDGLIPSICLHDGNRFPQIFRTRQYRSWHDYALIGGGFRNSLKFLELQTEIQQFAANVALTIDDAPLFDEKWLEPNWVTQAIQKYSLDLINHNFHQPIL